MAIPETGNINFDRMDEFTKVGLINQAQNRNSGLLGGAGLSQDVINLALIMGGIKSLGAQPAGRNFADNLAEGVSQGIQLGAALQPKPPLIPVGEDSIQKSLGEKGADRIVKITNETQQARNDIDTYNQLIALVENQSEDDFGSFATTRLEIAKGLKLFGVDIDKDVPVLELINNIANKVVLAGLANFKGAISDGERKFLVDMSAGIGQSKEGALNILKMAKHMAELKVEESDALSLYRTQTSNPLNDIQVPFSDGTIRTINFDNFVEQYKLRDGGIGKPGDKVRELIIENQNFDVNNVNNYVRTVMSDGTVVYAFQPKGVKLTPQILKRSLSEKEFEEKFGTR